jgi:hypothetical protein
MLKALQLYQEAKSEMNAGGAIAPYVRLFLFAACALTAILGIVALILLQYTGVIVMYATHAPGLPTCTASRPSGRF